MFLTAKEMEVILYALNYLPKLMEDSREDEMNALYEKLCFGGFHRDNNEKSATLQGEDQ